MPRIYCINCYERPTRFKESKKELQQNGFNKVNWIRNKRNKIGGKGCFLSHLDCYIDFLKSKDKFCIIFEDDVKFINKSQNNYKYIQKIIKNSPNYDILFLGCRAIKSKALPKNPEYLKGRFLQAHSYIISKYAANKILDYYKKYKKWQHIDMLFNILNLNTYALKNNICIQRRSKSDNQWLLKLESITNSAQYENLQLIKPTNLEKMIWHITIFIYRIRAFNGLKDHAVLLARRPSTFFHQLVRQR